MSQHVHRMSNLKDISEEYGTRVRQAPRHSCHTEWTCLGLKGDMQREVAAQTLENLVENFEMPTFQFSFFLPFILKTPDCGTPPPA